MSFFVSVINCSDYYRLVVLKLGNVSLATLFFFSKIVVAILGVLYFHINFRISLSISPIKIWDFYRNYVESVDKYGN